MNHSSVPPHNDTDNVSKVPEAVGPSSDLPHYRMVDNKRAPTVSLSGTRRRGQKLTVEQKRIIEAVLVEAFCEVPEAMRALQRQYPEFSVDRGTLYDIRNKLDAGILARAQAERNEALTTGLSVKAHRVAMYRAKLVEMLEMPLEIITYERDDAGEIVIGRDGKPVIRQREFRADLAREIREYAKLLAKEVGTRSEIMTSHHDKSDSVRNKPSPSPYFNSAEEFDQAVQALIDLDREIRLRQRAELAS